MISKEDTFSNDMKRNISSQHITILRVWPPQRKPTLHSESVDSGIKREGNYFIMQYNPRTTDGRKSPKNFTFNQQTLNRLYADV